MNSGEPHLTANTTPLSTQNLTVPEGKIWYVHPGACGDGEWIINGVPNLRDIFIDEGSIVSLTCGSTNLDSAWLTYIEFTPPLSYADIDAQQRKC